MGIKQMDMDMENQKWLADGPLGICARELCWMNELGCDCQSNTSDHDSGNKTMEGLNVPLRFPCCMHACLHACSCYFHSFDPCSYYPGIK